MNFKRKNTKSQKNKMDESRIRGITLDIAGYIYKESGYLD